ncbi:MAG TPA: diaminopimelate epimerase [Steroidobacteraceae bacterium]|nr:diaminopimelate epimerase [Steroidobacteraceae bacterium]
MRLAFLKMHGLGNDFIVFDAATPEALPGAAQLRALADRHTGIGFDQALVLAPPRRADTAVFYRIFNADGGEAEQCGNGARCIAALVARRLGRGPGELLMDSPAGLVRARLRADGLVSVAMGVPSFAPAALPFTADREASGYALEVAGERLEIGIVSIGNPHAVIRVPAVANAPVDRLGRAVENHPRFPRGTNVEFMEVVTPAHVRLRVHERGVGETQACGTGACGAVAVGRRRGWLDAEVEVDVPGGRLAIEWPRQDEPIWLTGPTATVFEGHIDL